MNENLKAALQKIGADPELAAKLKSCKTPDEAYDFASSVQDGYTKEEFVSAMKQIKDSLGSAGELTDEDLNKMAGGVDDLVSGILPLVTFTAIAFAI